MSDTTDKPTLPEYLPDTAAGELQGRIRELEKRIRYNLTLIKNHEAEIAEWSNEIFRAERLKAEWLDIQSRINP